MDTGHFLAIKVPTTYIVKVINKIISHIYGFKSATYDQHLMGTVECISFNLKYTQDECDFRIG